jgi:uncharacterized membrane protein YphA (DoxX/SURF4 family)
MEEINNQNKNWRNKMKSFAPVVVRIGLALVFLWFGSQQLLNNNAWIGLIPNWIVSTSGLSAITLVYINGVFEVVFASCLLLGLFTRVISFILTLHLLHITTVVGYTGIGVRDFGLTMAMFSIFLNGIDSWSLDKIWLKK